jgi:hypothetical protein
MARASFRLKMFWNPDTQTDLVIEELIKLAQRNGKSHKQDREKTIATWQGARPAWRVAIKRIGQDIVRFWVLRMGEPFGQQKWGWLDEGTRVRYRWVSEDWQSKTKPNRLRAGPGRGRALFLGPPWPGIKARNWNININKKLSARLARDYPKAVQRGLNRRRRGKFGGVTGLFITE